MFRAILLILLLMVPGASSGAIKKREWPVEGGTLTSGIGYRVDPFGSGRTLWHNGIDIAVPPGTPVFPTRPGIVIYSGTYAGYGNLVTVDHGDGSVTMYGHNAELRVKVGERVPARRSSPFQAIPGGQRGRTCITKCGGWQETGRRVVNSC